MKGNKMLTKIKNVCDFIVREYNLGVVKDRHLGVVKDRHLHVVKFKHL